MEFLGHVKVLISVELNPKIYAYVSFRESAAVAELGLGTIIDKGKGRYCVSRLTAHLKINIFI